MKFIKSFNYVSGYLILTGTIFLALSACSSSGGGGNGSANVNGSPQIIGSVELPGEGSGVVVDGSYAYVSAGNSGLQVIDVANKSAPVIVADETSIYTSGGVEHVSVSMHQYLYMAGGLEGVHVVEVTTPTMPSLVVTTPTAGNNHDLAYSSNGSTLCAADGPNGVLVFYGVNGEKNVATPESTYGVANIGDYCFATGGTELGGGSPALYVIDISVPASAFIAQTLPLAGSPSGIAIAGNYAYIPAGDPGMYVIDITTPSSSVIAGETGALPVTGPIAVDATRMRAYLGTVDTVGFPNDGLKIIDISNPASPAVIATADLPDYTGGLAALDGFVYITTFPVLGSSATSQFHIVDVSAY